MIDPNATPPVGKDELYMVLKFMANMAIMANPTVDEVIINLPRDFTLATQGTVSAGVYVYMRHHLSIKRTA